MVSLSFSKESNEPIKSERDRTPRKSLTKQKETDAIRNCQKVKERKKIEKKKLVDQPFFHISTTLHSSAPRDYLYFFYTLTSVVDSVVTPGPSVFFESVGSGVATGLGTTPAPPVVLGPVAFVVGLLAILLSKASNAIALLLSASALAPPGTEV